MTMNAGSSIVHPDFVKPYIQSEVDRWNVLDVVLPPVASPRYFIWHKNLTMGHVFDQVSQYGRGDFDKTQLAQNFVECIPYAKAIQWHEDMEDPRNLFSRVKMDMELLVRAAALTQESLRVEALTTQPAHEEASNENKLYKDCNTDEDYWVDGGGGFPNIRDDINDARGRMLDFGPANPNTMFVSPKVLTAMRKDIKNSEWDITGPVGQSLIRSGQFPGVPENNWKAYQGTYLGLNVFVSNAVKLVNQLEPSGNTELLIDDTVIICDTAVVGEMATWKPFKVIEDYDKVTESWEYHARMWIAPVIYKPAAIYLIKNVINPTP